MCEIGRQDRIPKGFLVYTLNEYGHMLADNIRVRAYREALARVIRPGSVVVEIGTGVGYFALAAASLGAKRVYAFELTPSIHIAANVLEKNGNRVIQLIRAHSTKVALTEQADVLFSDLRGSVPAFADHFASIIDARRRFLAPGGALIPQRDQVWGALVESPAVYYRNVEVWRSVETEYDLSSAILAQTSTPAKCRFKATELLSDEQLWMTFEYSDIVLQSFTSVLTFRARRSGMCHGLALWFETELWDGIGYTNHPSRPPMIYGQTLFPFSHPLQLKKDESVTCELSALILDGLYVWRWKTTTSSQQFDQSNEALPEVFEARQRAGSETVAN